MFVKIKNQYINIHSIAHIQEEEDDSQTIFFIGKSPMTLTKKEWKTIEPHIRANTLKTR